MKNKINILFLLLIVSVMTACVEEVEPFNGPYRLNIVGVGETTPGVNHTYTIGDFQNPDSYSWSVEGPAQIVGSTSGTTVALEFLSVGDVVLTVSNGVSSGNLPVSVVTVEPLVTTSYNGTGILNSGAKDTVFFTFDAPLAEVPDIALNTDTSGFAVDTDAFVSGSLSDLSLLPGSETTYYAIYTAGEGDGTPEAFISDIKATEAYGGLPLDSLGYTYTHLYEVDNTDPIVDLAYSDKLVNDSTEVTITATFSEPVTFASTDSVIYISFSGAGVAAENDTLQPTSDPLVYTYDYTVNGEGNGNVTVDITNITDLAGNELATINNASVLTVDNSVPIATVLATDSGDYASIVLTSTEDGAGMYLVLADGETAPTTTEEFMEIDGVASGSVDLAAGVPETANEVLATGSYDVYVLTWDGAGNYSPIVSADLTMD